MIASYTPRHNGLAEKRNRILLDMVRNMLKEKKFPNTLWGEVVITTAYVLNRCPTKKLKEIVPFERWTGDKQSVSHFRVFGSICYKHVPNTTRKKLDDISKVVLLVGYHSTTAYKFYCPFTNKVEVSRDVVMKESEVWDWSKSQSNSGVELTSEDIDSDSEDETEPENDFESESESEGEIDSEEEYDSGDPDSSGSPDSWNIPDSEGGRASEVGTSEVPTSDIVPKS